MQKSTMAMELNFFFFFGSTHSYLSVMRIEELAARAGVSVNWRPSSVRALMREQCDRRDRYRYRRDLVSVSLPKGSHGAARGLVAPSHNRRPERRRTVAIGSEGSQGCRVVRH